MTKIKGDLSRLILVELLSQLGTIAQHDTRGGSCGNSVASVAQALAIEFASIDDMLAAGELTQEQAVMHRELRINAAKINLLAVEGVNDIIVAGAMEAVTKVVRRFYGV